MILSGFAAWLSLLSLGDLAPLDAIDSFELEPGLTIELVAAEPLTVDPVALAFDERGRLFVAENRDYPTGSPDGRALGIVAMLEDSDADGSIDKRTDFATGIKFPNGVMPWRGGVIVTAAPDVFWLADTNSDGVADIREVLLTGFDTNASSQLRANDPTLGPDGWIYIAGGLRGGKVYSPARPGVVVDTDKGDVRFRPETGEIELVTGKSQFGLAFDDAGNRFACMNRIQVQHAPLPLRYLARNPAISSPGALQDCPDIAPNSLMTRYTAGAARIYPISDNITTADSHLGTYSAACAVHIYRGTNLPALYHGAAFSCDPTGNLVRADRLEKVGGTFSAHRIREGTEALRSRDNWFRPVFIADGPDGALYIADMYRKTIEHPEYLPGEVRKHTDFESGKDKGRIWRLAANRQRRPASNLAQADLNRLVGLLASPAPWERDTAFRLLLERRDRSAIRELRRAPLSVPTLNLLELFGGLDAELLLGALNHADPAVRQNAVRIAEPKLRHDSALRAKVLALEGDPDPHVRFQTALSLGEAATPEIVPALARIAATQGADRWTRAAILSSAGTSEYAAGLLGKLTNGAGMITLAMELGRQLGSAITNALPVSAGDLSIGAYLGVARATPTALRQIATSEDLFAKARRLARLKEANLELRLAAIDLVAFDDSDETADILSSFLDPGESIDVHRSAVRSLTQPARAQALAPLLTADRWNEYTPGIRTMFLDRLSSAPELAGILLGAIEGGGIPVSALSASQRDRLRNSRQPEIKERAAKLFMAPGGDREKAFREARAALELKAVPASGKLVFEKACASCHRLDQQGVAVGPDLFDIRNQPKESILYHIIVPEAEIAPHFVNYECELKDGRIVTGILSSESAGSITLRMAQGFEEVIPRTNIARLQASRLSLMPQELERDLSLQDLADLLAYLRGER